MTLIKKRDVKDYFASRRQRNQIHMVPASEPVVADTSVANSSGSESVPAISKVMVFNVADPSSSDGSLKPPGDSKAAKIQQFPAGLRRATD